MVFQLQDNNNNFSGKSFDWDANKSFFKNLADKVFIAPTSEQLSLLKQYNDLTGKAPEIQKEFLSTLDDKDPLKTYFTTLDGGIATQKGMAGALNKTTLASKAATLGMKALSMAGNVIVMLAISAAIGAVVEKLGEAKKASEDAAAAIGDLNNEIKSLDDLKKSMLELRTELDKGNLSHGDAYDKRLELMKIQDTLIEKYGKEAKGINFVTGSIKEQEQAIDDLARAEEQKWKRENQSAVNDSKDYLTKKSDGKMTFEDQWNSLKGDKTFDFLKSQVNSLGGELKKNIKLIMTPLPQEHHITTSIEFDGTTVDEQIEKYQELFDVLEKYKRTSEINVDSELGEISNKIKALKSETYNNHKDVFDKYTEIEVTSNESYRNIYADALNAKEEYNEAILNGGNDSDISASLSKMEQIEKAFLDTGITDIGVSEYFQNFFNAFNLEAGKHKFKINIKANKDSLDTDIKQALSDLDGLDDQGILNIGKIEGTEDQEAAYNLLSEKAEAYGTEIGKLIEWLVELGLVQGRVSDDHKSPDLSILSLEDANKQLDDLQSKYQTLSGVIDDYNSKGHMTIDNLQSFLSLGNEYMQYLSVENGQLTMNKDALVQLALARIDDAEAAYLETATNLIGTFAEESSAAAYLKSDTDNLISSRIVLAEANWSVASSAAGIKAAETGSDTATKAVEALQKTVANARVIFDVTRSSVGKYTSAISEAGSATQNASKQISDAQKNINNLLSMTIQMLRKEYELQKEVIQDKKKALELELKALQKKIDLQLELLQKKKEEHDYERDLKGKQKDVSNIQNELFKLRSDDSAEARKKRLELESELADKLDELNEFLFDNEIELQEDALNKEKDRVEEEYQTKQDLLDQEIEAIERYVSMESNLRLEAMALIEVRSQEFYNRLQLWNYQYGDGLRSTIDLAWQSCYASMDMYNNGQYNVANTLEMLAQKMADFEGATRNAIQAANELNNALGQQENKRSQLQANIKQLEIILQNSVPSDPDYAQTVVLLANYKKQLSSLPKHHDGNIVNGNSPVPLSNLAKLTGGEVLIKALKGELVVTQQQQANLIKSLNASHIAPYISTPKYNISTGNITVTGGVDKSAIEAVRKSQQNQLNNLITQIKTKNDKGGY